MLLRRLTRTRFHRLIRMLLRLLTRTRFHRLIRMLLRRLTRTRFHRLIRNAAAPVDPNAVPPVDPNAAAPADPNAVPPVDPNASAPNIAKAAAELSTSGDIIQRVLRADIRYLLNEVLFVLCDVTHARKAARGSDSPGRANDLSHFSDHHCADRNRLCGCRIPGEVHQV